LAMRQRGGEFLLSLITGDIQTKDSLYEGGCFSFVDNPSYG